ncbi:MAG: hypothetical protein ACOYK9_01885 [Chlamydiia bacterium]
MQSLQRGIRMKKFIFLLQLLHTVLHASPFVDSELDENKKLISIDLKQLGSISYQYEGPLLKTIHRINGTGEILYTHEYVYDSKGHLTKEMLIGNTGTIEYNISNHYFSI